MSARIVAPPCGGCGRPLYPMQTCRHILGVEFCSVKGCENDALHSFHAMTAPRCAAHTQQDLT